MERLRTFGPAPYYATITFEVVDVTGTPKAADARIRVTSMGNWKHGFPPIHVGEIGTLRLRRGIVTDSLTHAYYCTMKVDATGVCGI